MSIYQLKITGYGVEKCPLKRRMYDLKFSCIRGKEGTDNKQLKCVHTPDVGQVVKVQSKKKYKKKSNIF